MNVVISILHYKNEKDTKACLSSLQKIDRKGINLKTIVVDNSQEVSLDLSEFDDLNLELIKNIENLGFTGGHNTAFQRIKNESYDVFLLLNNDCIVDKDFLKEIIKPFEKKDVGATVSKIYFAKGNEYHKEKYKEKELGKVIWFAGGKMDWNTVSSVHIGVDEVDNGQYDEEKEVTFATGASIAVRKEILDKIGLFDDNYFLYYEDADLCTRINKSGFKLMYVPKSVVWHKNAGSSGSGSKLHDYYLTRNRLYFGVKYAPLKMKVLLIKEGLRLLRSGREWQKIGIRDYFLHKMGKGSFNV